MAELSSIYGENYKSDTYNKKKEYIENIISNNIANRNFYFQLDEIKDIWNNNIINMNCIDNIINRIQKLNSNIIVSYLDKNNPYYNIMEKIVLDENVIYLWVIDSEMSQSYFIYITKNQVGAL